MGKGKKNKTRGKKREENLIKNDMLYHFTAKSKVTNSSNSPAFRKTLRKVFIPSNLL